MKKERIEEIVHQVLYNPQVSYPPISYEITDKSSEDYTSEYMDKRDFMTFLERLEAQLVSRFSLENKTPTP